MRTSVLTLLLVQSTSSAALALGDPPGTMNVVNQCDEAVQVTVMNSTPFVLEPNESENVAFPEGRASIHAELVSTPSVSADANCRVKSGEETVARITCSTSRSGVRLRIRCVTPDVLSLEMIRESSVLVCSGGGLGLLFLISTLLGRGPGARTRAEEHEVRERRRGIPIDSIPQHSFFHLLRS